MSFSTKYSQLFKFLLPTPFTIAVILTLLTFLIALIVTLPDSSSISSYSIDLIKYWEEGVWNSGLMVFAMQMMLMLVLGHVLALTKPVDHLLSITVKSCNSTAKAAAIVTLLTVMVSLFNWGLGLIFGAIFARKVGEYSLRNGVEMNYPLIGAAGYSGLMVWHGGLSGSSLAKVAEPGHIKSMMTGIFNESQLAALPDKIPYGETVGSSMNLVVMMLLVLVLPLTMYWLGKKSTPQKFQLSPSLSSSIKNERKTGAEKLDHSTLFSIFFGGIIFLFIIYKIVNDYEWNVLAFFTPNNINLMLFALAILLHKNFTSFLKAIDEAISGAAGILIQFPLYFGIMGIMRSAGLVNEISDFFVQVSTSTTYPIFTFLSAGLVNVFVPSGGGQWAVQGPIIIQAASNLGLSLPKSIMALAYGDQLTNMLQPFWALPLLGITELKAKEILPYTLLLMLVGGVIFMGSLLFF